jgi:hypothetical protein
MDSKSFLTPGSVWQNPEKQATAEFSDPTTLTRYPRDCRFLPMTRSRVVAEPDACTKKFNGKSSK